MRIPTKLFEWASEHHGDPNYDRARRSLAFSTVGYQHEKAFEEIAQITDPAERESVFDEVGWIWMPENPEVARDFFETSDLIPDEVRYKMLSNFY